MLAIKIFFQRAKQFGLLSALKDTKRFVHRQLKHHLNKGKGLEFILPSHEYQPPSEMVDLIDLVPKQLTGAKNNSRLVVWIIPDFDIGSGGHSTIFRFSQMLSFLGFEQHFMVHGLHFHHDAESVVSDINQKFRRINKLSAEVFWDVGQLLQTLKQKEGYAIFGTCWKSQYLSLAATSFDRRFAFVQDREGLFRAYDGISALADSTLVSEYSEVITAGPWLASHYPEATKFTLGADTEIIHALNKATTSAASKNITNKPIKIAVYGRFVSPRRAVDLVWMTLMKLNELKRDYQFEVHSFGAPLGNTKFPFPVVDHGVLSQTELNVLLSTADIGIAYSTTNYSILPIEMLAAGLKTFDLETAGNKANYEGLPVSLLSPLPSVAATQLHAAICEQTETSINIDELSWESTFSHALKTVTGDIQHSYPTVSVCIPTYNGADILPQTLEALKNQKYINIELNIVDSGSTDGTTDTAERYFSDAKIKVIDKSEFGHGKTRNTLATMATSEYVLFLTQDAIPLDPMLLRSLVSVMEEEKAGLVFSRHISNPLHGPFVARDLNHHFDHLLSEHGSTVTIHSSASDDVKRFSSDNCAMYRKSELSKTPFPDIEYGEDQVWAYEHLKSNGKKCYLAAHTIMHSHSLGEAGSTERAEIETDYFIDHFNVQFDAGWTNLNAINKADELYAQSNGISASVLKERLEFNAAVIKGRKAALDKRT